jgi:hypothetical protein
VEIVELSDSADGGHIAHIYTVSPSVTAREVDKHSSESGSASSPIFVEASAVESMTSTYSENPSESPSSWRLSELSDWSDTGLMTHNCTIVASVTAREVDTHSSGADSPSPHDLAEASSGEPICFNIFRKFVTAFGKS